MEFGIAHEKFKLMLTHCNKVNIHVNWLEYTGLLLIMLQCDPLNDYSSIHRSTRFLKKITVPIS